MIVILFRSKLTAAAGEDDDAMSKRMLDLAHSAPGFVDIRFYKRKRAASRSSVGRT